MNTLTAHSNPSSARDWISDNRHPLGIAAAILTLLFVLWIIFAPSKIEPFTIATGEGVNAHVSYEKAIDLAEQNNLPLYTGQGWNESNRISYADARALQDDLARTQVTVRVRAGDHFDENGNYTPAEFVSTLVAGNAP